MIYEQPFIAPYPKWKSSYPCFALTIYILSGVIFGKLCNPGRSYVGRDACLVFMSVNTEIK